MQTPESSKRESKYRFPEFTRTPILDGKTMLSSRFSQQNPSIDSCCHGVHPLLPSSRACGACWWKSLQGQSCGSQPSRAKELCRQVCSKVGLKGIERDQMHKERKQTSRLHGFRHRDSLCLSYVVVFEHIWATCAWGQTMFPRGLKRITSYKIADAVRRLLASHSLDLSMQKICRTHSQTAINVHFL